MVLTIMGMGMATLAIGILPGYSSIGIWAPALLILIRLLQSFCTAGQYSGAALVAGESAPPLQRARYVSIVPMGSAAGFMLASALTSWLHGYLDINDMLRWGWRIPFVVGGVLTLAGWFVRQGLEETPDFENLQNEDAIAEAPLKALFRNHLKLAVSLLCIVAVAQAGYYIVLAYMATYLEVGLGFSATQAAAITTIALVAYLPFLYLCAAASDRFGRRAMLFASSILFLLGSYPAFVVLASGGFVTALVVQLFLVAILAFNDSTVATFFLESFPAKIRFSGFALPYNVGAAIFGGAAPMLAEWLIQFTGNEKVPAFMMMGVAALSLPALMLVHETAPGIIIKKAHRAGSVTKSVSKVLDQAPSQ